MGFLSNIAGAALQFGIGALTGQPAIATAASVVGSAGVSAVLGSPAAAARRGVGVGGNGVTHLQTIVQSIDNATGAVVREDIMKGTPFLMNSDMIVARRVFKMLSEANAKLPRKTVRQTETTALKNQLVNTALQAGISHNVHHSGHSGNG